MMKPKITTAEDLINAYNKKKILLGGFVSLLDYLKEKNTSIQDFADSIEYTRTHISRVAHGKSKPSKRLVKDIQRVTDGRIKF